MLEVPPLAKPSVPATVTAPAVGLLGVSPVVPKVIEVTAEVLFERKVMIDGAGQEVELPPDRATQLAASRVLQAADNAQWERDNPEAAGKAKGSVNVTQNNSTQVNYLEMHKAALEAEHDEVERRVESGGSGGDVPEQ